MTPNLPRPIAAYFAADAGDSQKFSECFTGDAVVKDEGHTYNGRTAIRQWKESASAKYAYTCEPLACEHQGGNTVVTSRLTGNFPGSPLNLRFFFAVEGDKIASLEVIPCEPSGDSRANDSEALISIVREMTESMTGAQSTRHWSEDALWFDIPPFASRGIQPALQFFDRVFGSFQSCQVDILEMDVVVNGDMGMVCTIQRVNVVLKNGDAKRLLVRETDCFENRNGAWKLIHQHASVPSGEDWDGQIVTA